MTRLFRTGALLGLVGCASVSIQSESTTASPEMAPVPRDASAAAADLDAGEARLPSSDLDATQIAERWFEQSQGFDGLEAYEIRGLFEPFEFAIARKWDGRKVKVLFYVTEPKKLDETSALILREPNRPAELYA